jgi:hypothetical protein
MAPRSEGPPLHNFARALVGAGRADGKARTLGVGG